MHSLVQTLTQQLNDKDVDLSQTKKELDEAKEFVAWYEKEPHKAGGLKKCNKCKRYTWLHCDKFCINMQCVTNLKVYCVAGAQTGEEEEVLEGRFEELAEDNKREEQDGEFEQRMARWRMEQEVAPAVALASTEPADNPVEENDTGGDEEHPHKRHRHYIVCNLSGVGHKSQVC